MSDSIQSWLNAAGRFPLLPQSELIRLAKKRDTLTPGSKAYVKVINKICEHNLRLVPNIVRKYVSKRSGYSMNSEVTSDLLQQGYIGLRRAAEKFDPSKGYTFSTYAYRWISQAFTRWHNSHDRAVYIPENAMTEVLYRWRHGERSKSKNGSINDGILDAAIRAMEVSSIDQRAGDDEEGTTIADLMCDDNLLLDRVSPVENRAKAKIQALMDECGIKPRVQQVVMTYARKGNMQTTAYQLGVPKTTCRNLYQEAVRQMKERVEEREAAKASVS